MKVGRAEELLPATVLSRASLRGNEYAWSVSDIPDVIDAAESVGLASVGGQLQFRLQAGTCECYWVEVDCAVEPTLTPSEKVRETAAQARKAFSVLKQRYDFIQEGWKAFNQHFVDAERNGESLSEAMCFVWYVEEPNS